MSFCILLMYKIPNPLTKFISYLLLISIGSEVMGLFDFLKKKGPDSRKPEESKDLQASSMKNNNATDQKKEKMSIDDAINRVIERYAELESKLVSTSPNCPYCKSELEKMPGRTKNCPHCQNQILVRTSPVTHDKVLLQNENVANIEKLWSEYRYSIKWMKKLNKQYDVSSPVFSKKTTELSTKFGSDPNQPDVIWGIFNDLAIKKMGKKPVNYGELSGLYFDEALFLYETDKPFFKALQESNRMMLISFQQQGIHKVEIPACDDSCEHCRKHGGRILTVNQALRDMPIPRKDCTHELEKGKPGWCRCVFSPV